MRKDLYYNLDYLLILITISLRTVKITPVKRQNWRATDKKRLKEEIKGKMPNIRILNSLRKINAYIHEIIIIISKAVTEATL
jgi:hypothetical protein